MDREEITGYIAKTGFMTLEQLRFIFKGDNEEILDISLTALVEKNKIRRVNFRTAEGTDILYYIPE